MLYFYYAPHYRQVIYKAIDNEFNSHFYFGENLRYEKIKKMDIKCLNGFQKELKISFFKFPIPWEWWSGLILLAFKKEYKVFLITPETYALNQWIFMLLCLFLNKKVYTWEHGILTKNISNKAVALLKTYNSLHKGSFLYGNRAKKIMTDLGINPNKLFVVYNSLNYDESFSLRKSLTDSNQYAKFYSDYFKNNDPVVLFIGRLTKQKKIHLLIEAHKLLSDKGINVNVVIIGDGDKKNDLVKTVSGFGLKEKYMFCGEIYEEKQIAQLLYNATICVSPGNVGLTAIHAFSYGLPVITNNNFDTQMPEYEIIIENENGLFFNEDDSVSLANAIEIWLKQSQEREKIRLSCYAQIDNYYNHNSQINRLKDILKKDL